MPEMSKEPMTEGSQADPDTTEVLRLFCLALETASERAEQAFLEQLPPQRRDIARRLRVAASGGLAAVHYQDETQTLAAFPEDQAFSITTAQLLSGLEKQKAQT
jgi:hypothetical protein